MRLTARLRRRVSLLLVACLLFQLAAVSAYACAHESAPAQPAAAMPGMADCPLAHPQPEAPSALCDQHCTPDRSITPDLAAPSVPALLPEPVTWRVEAPRVLASADLRVPLARSDPPPRLRFCSLLI